MHSLHLVNFCIPMKKQTLFEIIAKTGIVTWFSVFQKL
jgi:hypothetical protein